MTTFVPDSYRAGLCCMISLFMLSLSSAWAIDSVTWKDKNANNETRTSLGRALVKAADGGILFQERSGYIRSLEPEILIKGTRNSKPFVPMTTDEITAEIIADLPDGFSVHKTARYVIIFNTSRPYAQWVGLLLERLNAGFENYWKNQGITLTDPEFPVVALIFANKNDYNLYALHEFGEEIADGVAGFYSLPSNRICIYDFNGTGNVGNTAGVSSFAREIIRTPGALAQIATVIHEATHQIAFNRGLMVRYADTPLWLSEGMAMFFETPDLGNAGGWRGIGKVNLSRLHHFREYLRNGRPQESLNTLLTDDSRFRNEKSSKFAYAEAWAFTYFLLKTRPKDYVSYLKRMESKKPFIWDSPQKRLDEFEASFGPIKKIDAAFLKFISHVK